MVVPLSVNSNPIIRRLRRGVMTPPIEQTTEGEESILDLHLRFHD